MLIKNQRGQGELGPVLVVVCMFVLFIFLVAKLPHFPKSSHHHNKKVKVTAQKIKSDCSGKACKQSYFMEIAGDWWEYDVSGASNANSSDSLPPGGTWAKAEEPDEDEVESQESVDVSEADDGSPSADTSDGGSAGDSGGDSGGDGGGGDGGGGD